MFSFAEPLHSGSGKKDADSGVQDDETRHLIIDEAAGLGDLLPGLDRDAEPFMRRSARIGIAERLADAGDDVGAQRTEAVVQRRRLSGGPDQTGGLGRRAHTFSARMPGFASWTMAMNSSRSASLPK